MSTRPDFSLDGFVKGVRRDIDAVYRWTYNTLYNKARQVTGDPDVAKDIVHNLFEKLCAIGLPKGTQFASDAKLESYLTACVHNAALSYLDTKRNRGQSHKEIANLWPDDGGSTRVSPTEYELIKLEMAKHVHQIIETLPNGCKIVFKLIKLEAKTRHEVAEMLGISVRTVDSQLGKANKIFTQKVRDLRLDSYFIVLALTMIASVFFG